MKEMFTHGFIGITVAIISPSKIMYTAVSKEMIPPTESAPATPTFTLPPGIQEPV